ncbi:hypothetical protein ACFR9U_13400 [Halorientalis brevis]|uniref:Cell surface protein n=1 Tax=Halorientalis brevis TaxID=1126241 RepID=A0ABD6CDG1_9EURY|nr:hypothetical protein [Halorientalis brevis]
MDFVWRVRALTIGVILFVLLISGPAVGVVDLTPEQSSPDSLGDGTADVTMASDPAKDLRIDEGRFGTGVYYLRMPPAVVDVSSIEGRPQLTYKVSVPGLDYTDSTSEMVDSTGRTTVHLDDRAFAPKSIKNDSYRAEVVVRVQSFEMDTVVYHRNVTVTVDD